MLRQRAIPFERRVHSATYTSQELADAEHVSGYMVAKPVIVKGRSGYTMCVLAACDHLDLNKVANVLGEKDVQLAEESEMQSLFPDCEIGAEPPVGVLFDLKTIMDERLRRDQHLVMQAGSHTEAVDIRREDWEELCKPVVAVIRRG
jgi:Ala-tRNA(Pro) deacylase